MDPTTIAVVPTNPNTAVRATLSRVAGCAGVTVSAVSGNVVEGVAVLEATSSIGDSLHATPRCATAGDKIFMKLQ
jgi:hypothetical protein